MEATARKTRTWIGYSLVGVLVLGLFALTSQTIAAPEAAHAAALRKMGNTAFGYGENLTFAVKYKFVTAGYATMRVAPKPVTVSDRPCYDIQFLVRTTESFDKIFKVRDAYRTYVDVDGLFPWRFSQSVREGDYKRDFSANIDQAAHMARTTEGSFRVPAFVQDILSAFYYTRAYDLSNAKTGSSFRLHNFYGKKAHDLRVVVRGRKRVEVPAGTFNTIVVEPLVVEGGLFKSDGSILIYLTDDDRRIPVKVSTKVPIGSIDSELIKYSGVKGRIAAKVG